MEKKRIKTGPTICLAVACLITIASAFLPMAPQVDTSYLTDSGGDMGKWILATAIGILLFAVLAMILKKRGFQIVAGILGILGGIALAALNAFVVIGLGMVEYAIGIGVYVLFIGAALLFIFGIVTLAARAKVEDSN